MSAIFWRACARFLSRPAVVDWLIRQAQRTPYVHITGPDGSMYMERYWLFNPYPSADEKQAAVDAGLGEPKNWFPISIRLHRIMRPDSDQHLHDHPWNARTIILRGAYDEVRPAWISHYDHILAPHYHRSFRRVEGNTVTLKFGEYHRITDVSSGGVWTLFITGKYRGTWGFNVEGVKVPWRQYLGLEQKP